MPYLSNVIRVRLVGLMVLAITVGLMAVTTTQAHADLADLAALTWTERAPGVWKAQIGALDSPRLLDFVAGPPALEGLERMGAPAFPLPPSESAGQVYGSRASVRIPLGKNEALYGFGLQFKGINRRGEVLHLKVDHYGGIPGNTHAPVPFYVSSAGYGVLFNTARHLTVHAGVGNRKDSPKLPPILDRNTDTAWDARPLSDAVEASVQGPGLEVLLFAGPTPLDVVRRYNVFCGGGALPPRWGLGFWHRVPLNASDMEITAEIDQFFARKFPVEVVGLEPGWQSKSYPGTFDWNTAHFPDPSAFVSTMNERGVKVNLWENPYVSPESSIYNALLPYTGSHLVWLGVVPDYTIPEARAILETHHKQSHLDIGISGYKIDEVDGIDAWLWPDHATFPSGLDGEQMRQVYGLALQKMLYGMFHDRNERTYGLVRGSNAGASGMPFVIYSDYYDHKGYVAALCNSGFAGVLWTPEIRSAGSDAEWVRRMQTVCFSPMAMLNAWSSGMKPWSRPEVEEAIRDAMNWRMRFLPYVYSAFARYHQDGTPPFRAMALSEGFSGAGELEAVVVHDSENPYGESHARDADDQYMMGDSVLVAPLFGSETKRKVELPAGKWYDFYTGAYAGAGETIEVEATLAQIPLFVRDGGIVPLAPVAANTKALGTGYPLEVRHYGTAEGRMLLYDDDGISFDYEHGKYDWHELAVSRGADAALHGSMRLVKDGWGRQSFGEVTWVFMTPE